MRDREERRIWPVTEVRAAKGDDGLIYMEGIAAPFNKWSGDLGGFRERISPGFFRDALETSDVRFLVNHDGLPLARYRKPDKTTLELEERKEGLWFRTGLDGRDPDVQRLVPKVERGDLDQMSFAFQLPTEGGDTWDGNERTLLRAASIFDVSPVTYPAYVDTSVAMRSMPAAVRPSDWEYQMAALAVRERGW